MRRAFQFSVLGAAILLFVAAFYGIAPAQSVTGVPSSNTGIPIPGTTSAGLAPVVPATADVLACDTTPNITTQPVAFSTTWTMPAFTQTPGGSFQVMADMLFTSSAVPTTWTLSVNIDGSQAYIASATNFGTSRAAAAGTNILNFVLAAPGSSGSIYAPVVIGYARPDVGLNGVASPFSLNTVTSHTVSLLYQCNLSTTGNSIQLVALRPMRVW